MITIQDFLPDNKKGGVPFGVDRKKAAKVLREMAESLEASESGVGEIKFYLQSVKVASRADFEDFCITDVTLTFADHLPKSDGSAD
jgi:hypothetical protein